MPYRPRDPDSAGAPPPLELSDERLAYLQAAFDIEFRELVPEGVVYARRKADPHNAEDLVQGTLETLWEKWLAAGKIPAESQQRLFWRILHRRVSNHRRDRYTEERALEELRARTPTEEQAVSLPEDEEITDLQRLAARIPALLEELPEHYRQAYELMAVQGLTDSQAEAKVGVNRSTMRWRLMKARERIAVQLAAEGFDLSAKRGGKTAKGASST